MIAFIIDCLFLLVKSLLITLLNDSMFEFVVANPGGVLNICHLQNFPSNHYVFMYDRSSGKRLNDSLNSNFKASNSSSVELKCVTTKSICVMILKLSCYKRRPFCLLFNLHELKN